MSYLRTVKKILLVITVILIAAYFTTVNAVDGLDTPGDVVNTAGLGSLASHYIRFTLPPSSAKVEVSDYIIVDLVNFSGVTEPTALIGDYTGTPAYSTVANRVRITGISITPGSMISIRGVTAYNPNDPEQFDVYIRVTRDSDGLQIKNSAHVMATPTNGSIIVTSVIDANVGTLQIKGTASPGMFVTFSEGGTVIGTCVAEVTGKFSQIFPGINPAEHSILIFGQDQLNRMTPPSLVQVLPRSHEITTVSGILLPPTIEIDKTQISRGDSIVVTGNGPPGYTAKIITEAPVNSYEVVTDVNGNYTFTIADTADMEYGDHKVYAMVQDGLGAQSLFSLTLFFRVSDGTPPPGGGTDCDISRGDLNCDGTVDLADFSIMLYYWATSNPIADINNDGNVNLVDFSIMMFYWRG